jgi:serine phosphatase RsbU (regulator of sigma subunit)
MQIDEPTLKEKVLLLISRERELFALRNKHQRLLNWLALSQSLPEILDRQLGVPEICARFASRVVTLLKLQRVRFVELGPEGFSAFGTEPGVPSAVSAAARALTLERRSGVCNEPTDPAEHALADGFGLRRFLWYRLDVFEERPVLLVAGFDAIKAPFYAPFDQEDAEHFAHAGQHFESSLRSLMLVRELEQDKRRLERFNEELEQRVQERTEELGRANRELTSALAALRGKDQRLQEDLLQARAFQQGILPGLPDSAPVEFGAVYRPLDLVGGDIYDIAELGPGHYRVFIADATGHGVQGSMRTIVIKSEYDQLKQSHAQPESLLVQLNQRLFKLYSQSEMLSTACCFDVRLDLGAPTLRYVNAAQPPLLHVSRHGTAERYHDGPFLGLSPSIELCTEEFSLAPGDLVVACTDGICDQPGPAGGLFDFREAVGQACRGSRSLDETLAEVIRAFEAFRGPVPPGDDVTLVMARIGMS